MPARRCLIALVVLVLAGAFWTGSASAATPGEVTIFPVKPCSNLLPAPEGVLVQRCEESGFFAESAVVNLLPDGSLTSRATPVGRFGLVATGPSGELWLGVGVNGSYGLDGAALDRVAADGTVQIFPVPAAPRGDAAYVHGVVVDRDGTAWAAIGFEEYEGFAPGFSEGSLLRLSSDEQTKSFQLPYQLDPQGLVLGPEGNIWFTAIRGRSIGEHFYDPGTGFIGRLEPSGKLALFRTPVRGGEPAAIALGPDGRLWFTESLKSAIESIAPDGTFGRRYSLNLGYKNHSLVFGPEGDLWTEGLGGVDRVTPWGQETLFPGESNGVVAGTEGDIWSLEHEDVERLVPGAPGIDVRRLIGHMSSGAIGLLLACGGSASACEGTLDVELQTPPIYRQRHKGEANARTYRLDQVPYSVPAESQERLRIPVSSKALSLASLYRRYELREGIPLDVRATVTGGPPLNQTVLATLGTQPGSAR